VDEITPHSHPLSLEPNGHSKEYKAAIAAATSLVDLARYLSESASTIDTLEGVDRVTAMAEIQIRITECAEMLAGSNNSKRNDRSSRTRLTALTFVIVGQLSMVAIAGILYFLLH